jgi:hypothetical protein
MHQDEQEGIDVGPVRGRYARGGIMCEKLLKNFRSCLLVLSKFLEIFGATNLGKGSNRLDAYEWLLITDTLHQGEPQGVVHILTDDGCYRDTMKSEERVLEFTKLRDDLCDKTHNAVTNILVLGLESFEEVLQ